MRKKLIFGSIALFLLVCLSAAAMYLRNNPVFPAETTICETDVSRTFTWGASSRIQKTLDAYTITVDVDGDKRTFTSAELNLCLNEEALETIASALELGVTDVDYASVLTADTTVVQEWLNSTIDENRIEPVRAHLVWNEESCKFELEGSVVGEYNDTSIALEIVTNSILNLDDTLTISEADYHVEYTYPEQVAAEEDALQYANTLVSRELTYNFYLRGGEYAPEVITPAMLGSWLIIGEDGLSLTWDEEQIKAFADTNAELYSFEGEDFFLAHDGRKIDLTVTAPTNIIDAEALYNDITTSLVNVDSGDKAVPYSEQNQFFNYDGTYIEISIGEQKLFAYLNGELFAETDIVTGCAHCDHDTKTGVFSIKNHFTNIYLQDKVEYYVHYWMGFLIPKYGLHDADGWREPEEYGGETYKVDGSGGCVNVPREVIARMYDAFADGTPVIIYDDTYVITPEISAE